MRINNCILRVALLSLLVTFPSILVFAQSVKVRKRPSYVFSFNKKGILNNDIWIREEHGNILSYQLNQKSGKLKMNVVRRQGATSPNFIRVYTDKDFPFKYGKIEIRAKFPKLKGAGSSIWLRPVHGTVRKVSGEIDVIEWGDKFADSSFQANFHLWGDFDNKKDNHVQYPKWYKNKNFSVFDYHIYSVQWDMSRIVIKVDDRTVGVWYAKDYPAWPFTYGYELCLDNGFAGWDTTKDYEPSQEQFSFDIDWIKYYKLIQ